jgi:hypothetical protein
MCGKSAPPQPKVVQRDPVADEAKAQAEAQRKTNTETAAKKRRRLGSSLLTAGAAGVAAPPPSLLAQASAKPVS